MSADRSQKSGVVTWTVVTIVMVFAMYLATYPILLAWWWKHHSPTGTSSSPASPAGLREKWVMYLGMPYFLLASVPPLEEPMQAYLRWWMRRLILGGTMYLPAP